MKATQEQLTGIFRHIITLIGAIVLIFFSGAENLVGEVSASLLMLWGLAWSLVSKDGSPITDKITGIVRHAITIVSAFLLHFGKVDINAQVIQISATLINLIPFIWSFIAKKKS